MPPKATTKKVAETTNQDKEVKSKTPSTGVSNKTKALQSENSEVLAKKDNKVSTKKETTATTRTTTTTTTTSDTGTTPAVVTATDSTSIDNVVVASDTSETSITDNFTEFIAKFQGILSQLSSLKPELKNLERKTVKQLKVVQKIHNKKKRKGTRAPSGFVKPSLISDELATFLGKTKGSEMARTDVTREINKYIRANNLQDKENGRKINPDESLKTLLKIDDQVALTYFNLQRYMGPHFPKQTKTVEVTA